MYIFTGMWFVGPVVYALLLWATYRLFSAGKPRIAGIFPALLAAIAMLVLIMLALSSGHFGTSPGGGEVGEKTITVLWMFLVLAGVAAFGLAFCRGVWRTTNKVLGTTNQSNIGAVGRLLGIAPLAALVGSIYSSLFLSGMMPIISPNVGGGAIQPVRFILKDESPGTLVRSNCASGTLGIDSIKYISRPYFLVFADDRDYYILNQIPGQPAMRTLRIPKTSAEGIIFPYSEDSFMGPDDSFSPAFEKRCSQAMEK